MLIGKDAHSHETYNLRHRKNMQERCSFMCSVKRSSFERGLLRHFQHSTVHSALPGIPYRFRNRHMGNTCHPTRFRNGEQQPTRSRCRTESSLHTVWQVAGRPLNATGWRALGNGAPYKSTRLSCRRVGTTSARVTLLRYSFCIRSASAKTPLSLQND